MRDSFSWSSASVENMLITEWNTEEAKQVWYEEGVEDGIEKGLERGLEKGLRKGLERGLEKGREAVAKNALENGLSIEMIQKITGLDVKTIEKLGAK